MKGEESMVCGMARGLLPTQTVITIRDNGDETSEMGKVNALLLPVRAMTVSG